MNAETIRPWRAYLAGERPDLTRLQRELSTGPIVVAADESGPYLHAEVVTQLGSADEVLAEVPRLIELLNGMAALSFSGHRLVSFSGAIACDGNRYIFVGDEIRATDELTGVRVSVDITAGGVVTDAEGRVKDVAGLSSMQARLAFIRSYPELAEVYSVLGRGTPTWGHLYKAYELMGKAVGGHQRLEKRTGVSRDRIRLLTTNSNDPEVSGDAARHAVRSGPSAPQQITIAEGLAIVDELIQGYVRNGDEMRTAATSKA